VFYQHQISGYPRNKSPKAKPASDPKCYHLETFTGPDFKQPQTTVAQNYCFTQNPINLKFLHNSSVTTNMPAVQSCLWLITVTAYLWHFSVYHNDKLYNSIIHT